MMTEYYTATIQRVKQSINSHKWIVHADIENGHMATLYYPEGNKPKIGKQINVWFDVGGWATTDSPVYGEKNE